jgi:hypothetical protein
MARRQDRDLAIEEIRRVRRKFSARLAEALVKGKFVQELRRIGRKGRRLLENGHANGEK